MGAMILAKGGGAVGSVRPESSEQVIEYLPVSCLEVIFRNAQRSKRPRRIKEIKAKFDWDRFDPLHIMRTVDNRNHIADGQNRREAIYELFGDGKEVPCIVRYGNTEEEAAKLFLGFNTGRDPVNTHDLFSKRLTARDPETVDIHRIARSYGFHISGGSTSIRAVGSLIFIYRMKDGAKVLDSTLGFIRNVWPDDQEALDGIILKGVALFFASYGEAIDKTFWKQVARVHRANAVLSKAKSTKEMFGNSTSKAVVALLRSTYNNRRAKKLGEI